VSALLGLLWGSTGGRIASVLVLLGAVSLGYGLWHHRVYTQGYAAGGDAVQARWDAVRAQQQAAVDAKLKEQQEKTDAIVQANVDTLADYEARVEVADATGRALARQLRDAEARYRAALAGAVSPVPGGPGAAAPGAAGGDDPFTAALGAVFTECVNNSAQLDALIAEVNRNLNWSTH
jgi:hypothetical protein